MPDAFELPGMRRPVVPLMRSGDALIDEFVSNGLPRKASVVRTRNDLAEPAAGLRRVKPVWIGRRSLEVINLPSRKVRAVHSPLLAFCIRCQDKRALSGAHQHTHSAHSFTSGPIFSRQ